METSTTDVRTSSRLGAHGASDLYQRITDQVIQMLDQGVVPWRSPILGRTGLRHPRSLNSGKPYRGINVFLLAFTAYAQGYESSYWLTFRQALERGGNVKKGEKASLIVFWKQYEVKDKDTGLPTKVPILRYYSAFNVNQCENIAAPDAPVFTPTPFNPIDAAETIVKGYREAPAISHGGGQAFYRPSTDTVHIPEPTRFEKNEDYYATLFHEFSHSTGHSKRLDRQLDTDLRPFGSPDYGREELVAEMSAAFLCGHAGIYPVVVQNTAAYVSGWLGLLRTDKKLVVSAAGQAQRAADWILGQRWTGEGRQLNPNGTAEEHVTADEAAAAPAPVIHASGLARQHLLEQAARGYIRRGWAPIPIPAGEKGPRMSGWLDLRLKEEDVAEAFRGAGNIGLLLGEPSGHLVDVDLDCPEARDLADHMLPPTTGITGRPSSPASHRWYIARDVKTVRHRDPITHASIVELRGTGSQTLVGPSIHPAGEPYDPLNGEPAEVDADVLRERVEQLANEVVRLRHGALTPPAPPMPSPSLAYYADSSDHATLLKRAAAYLDALPPAISGQGGHNITFKAAAALVHGFALPQAEALDLLAQRYNPRCQPPWSDAELEHKVAGAAARPHSRPFGWIRDSNRRAFHGRRGKYPEMT